MRKPFEGPFKGSVVQDYYAQPITDLAEELIDSFIDAGTVELDDAFAAPFAIRMAGYSLGLSLDDVPEMTSIYSAIAGGMDYDGDPEEDLEKVLEAIKSIVDGAEEDAEKVFTLTKERNLAIARYDALVSALRAANLGAVVDRSGQ